uniref:Uncharacterized protein n=1 Tax=Kalanchoe fedtschenkoi TaxID=63787 RepID=A0A7N1A6Y1_KALFE
MEWIASMSPKERQGCFSLPPSMTRSTLLKTNTKQHLPAHPSISIFHSFIFLISSWPISIVPNKHQPLQHTLLQISITKSHNKIPKRRRRRDTYRMEGGGIIPVPSSFPMEKPYMIIRRSIYTFLQHYQYFTFAAALLALPFSASTLLSQPFTTPSSPLLHTIRARLQAIFAAAGFPQSDLLSVLSLKLAQSILTASYTLPCSLSFLLVAKAYTIKALTPQKPVFPSPSWSFVSLYGSLVYTYLCSAFVIVAANASAFSLLFLGFNFCEGLGFTSSNLLLFVSSAGAVAYSVILANVLVVCNLALVISGMERSSSGFTAMLRACVLVKGKTSTALLLALPTTLLLASIEGLFQYRIVRGYHSAGRLSTSMASESLFIAYLYSILVILDIIMSCIFFKSCRRNLIIDHASRNSYRIDIKGEEEEAFFIKMKEAGEFP